MQPRDPRPYPRDRRGRVDFYVVGLWDGYGYSRWVEGLAFSNAPELFFEYQDALDALTFVEEENPEVAECLDILKIASTHHDLGSRVFKGMGR
jgi:hypothetical protein